MKKLTLITAIILTANLMFAQYNKIDTSFYSEALQETKMVDVYFPPGYDENPDLYYPVIYYLHAWLADQNLMGSEMLAITQSMINNGSISPVIMVCADNSPDPFGGSMYTNSILWGDYEDYMIEDLIGWAESSFRAVPSKNYRALLGHSMGGYGAFRLGILHKEKFRVLAATASAMVNLTDQYLEYSRQKIMTQNPGPPFTYNYYTTEFSTKGLFLFCGAFSPNLNSPQTYILPQIVEFAMDSNGYWIDTIVDKMKNNSIDHLIHQLSTEDSVGILFGCGSADESIYPCHIAFKDTLDLLGLPNEFYDHTGGHIMPSGFKQRALIFIDSLLMPPLIPPTNCLPEGITFTTQEEIDNFQTNHPNCTEIEGDVTIGELPQSNIKYLNGLSVLTSLGGNLTIWANDSLTSLTGLNNLATIEGSLKIGANHNLANLTGLEGLSYIGGNLEIGFQTGMIIWGNYSLISLEGLNNLTSLGGSLKVRENNSLANFVGLNSLISIGGELYIDYNNALICLIGLENIEAESISNLFISSNGLLSTCEIQSICEYLSAPSGTIIINNNAPGCNSPEEVEETCFNSIKESINVSNISISPNPINNLAFLSMNINSKSSVEICFYNTTGICLKSWQFQNQPPGQKEFKLDLKDLPAGIYFCRVQIGNEMVTKKIIKVK